MEAKRATDKFVIPLLIASIIGLGGWVMNAHAQIAGMQEKITLDRQYNQQLLMRLEARIIRLDDKIDRLLREQKG